MLMVCRDLKTGKLLPTGNITDTSEGVKATCVDVGNPWYRGYNTSRWGQCTSNPPQDTRIHQKEGSRGYGNLCKDEASAPGSIPKIAMVSRPTSHKLLSGETIQGNTVDLVVRALSVGQPHRAVHITVALATAAAANLKGSTVHANISSERADLDGITRGHSSGKITVGAKLDDRGSLTQIFSPPKLDLRRLRVILISSTEFKAFR
jgi:2-methylaconitate cis-trans-isomerase PrpF